MKPNRMQLVYLCAAFCVLLAACTSSGGTTSSSGTTTISPPLCPAGVTGSTSAQCTPPVVEERDRFCNEKIPFTLIAIPDGATFEVLTSGITCKDGGVTDEGVRMLTCSGIPLFAFDLKVCNPACSAPAQGQCSQGYIYDLSQQCCAAAAPANPAGCVTITAGTGACP